MAQIFLKFILSLIVVVCGARFFIKTSISLARLSRFPEMVIGATIVSLATTMPESLVSLFASATNHGSLAFGNIVGSGLVNLGFLLGVILLAGHGQEGRGGRGKRRSLILFFLTLFVYLWFLAFGKIGLIGGMILIALAFTFLVYTLRYSLKESGETLRVVETKLEAHPKVLFKFLLGVFLLILGARFLVESGVALAQILGLPELVVGISLVAIGTSLPELVTALTALASGHEKISLGNLTGATVLTFTLALGLAAVISEVKVQASVLRFDLPLLLFFSGLTLAFSHFPRLPQKALGAFLIIMYLLYLVFVFL